MWGAEAIPARWLERLELREVIEELAADLTSVQNGSFDAEANAVKYPGH